MYVVYEKRTQGTHLWCVFHLYLKTRGIPFTVVVLCCTLRGSFTMSFSVSTQQYSSTFYWSVLIKSRKSAVWIFIGVSTLYFSTIFLFNVDTVETVLYYLLFRLDFRVVWYYLFWKGNKSCLYLRHPMACAVQLVDVLIIVHKPTSYSEPWHTTFFPLFWFEIA